MGPVTRLQNWKLATGQHADKLASWQLLGEPVKLGKQEVAER